MEWKETWISCMSVLTNRITRAWKLSKIKAENKKQIYKKKHEMSSKMEKSQTKPSYEAQDLSYSSFSSIIILHQPWLEP